MPFISLFYPAADAAEHFVAGQHLEIAGPVFRTYAEAVSELEQEAPDVAEQGLPVEAYVLEVKPLRNGGGYSIVDAFEVSFGGMRGGARARNPREPKTVEMPELRGFKLGPDRELTLDEAAAVYGDFMAHNIPAGVPAGKVRRAFGAAATPPSVERQRKASAAIRDEAAGKVASSLTRAVETHGVDGAKELVEDKLEAISAALDAGEITAPQAAPMIALETKKLQILDLLQRFCPPVGEEGAAAIYEVVRATLGGDEAAAEAGRVILEDVASRFTSAKVEVDDSAMPAPRKTRAKAAGKAAAAAAPGPAVFGDPTAFVKAYGSRIRGDAKLAKAIVANAVGLAPFPTGYPIAVLREATSDVYALLAEVGMVAEERSVYQAPVRVAQFSDPGLQAAFGGMQIKPLPVQPDDYIMREYSYETGLPVYGMRFNGGLPPDRTPDLAQAIAVAERMGVQTHTYYDATLPGGGADFRPIEEALERDAAERQIATTYIPFPSPVAAPSVVETRDREIERVIADLLGQKNISDDRGVRVYSADTLDRRSVEELFEHLRAARDSKARYLEIAYYLRQTYPYLRPFVDQAEVERDKAEARWLEKQAAGRTLSQTPFTDTDILDASSQGVTNTLVERLFVLVKRLEDSASALGFITDARGLSGLSVEQQSAAAYGLAEDAAGDAFAPADSPPQSSAEIALNLMTIIAPPSATPARLLPSYQTVPEPEPVAVSKPYVPLSDAELGSPTAIREQKAYVALTSDPIRWVLNIRDALANAPRTVKKYEEQRHNAKVFAEGAINYAIAEGGDLERALRNQAIIEMLGYNATGTTLQQIEEQIRKIENGPVVIPEWARKAAAPVAMPVPEPPPARSTGPRELSIAIDGFRGVEVPHGLLPTSTGYLTHEVAFGQLNIDEPPAVFRRSFAERDRGNRNAWKIVPAGSNFANIAEWASQYYTPAMSEPEPPPMPVAAPSVSAEERLAAKIAASNDAGLARLQAMLNG